MSTKREYENHEYAAMVRRMIRAHGKRVHDPADLGDLVRLRNELDAAIDVAIANMRALDYSWTEIAAELGITRQAARQRWGAQPSSANVGA